MSEYTTEKKYVIAEGDDGNLYFFISAKSQEPYMPQIIYDGKDHAIFLRNDDQKVILDYIHPDVRKKLTQVNEVVIVETIMDNIKDSYFVDMKIVDRIPVDWNLIGLNNWHEVADKK